LENIGHHNEFAATDVGVDVDADVDVDARVGCA
jgi:hypothetical protein